MREWWGRRAARKQQQRAEREELLGVIREITAEMSKRLEPWKHHPVPISMGAERYYDYAGEHNSLADITRQGIHPERTGNGFGLAGVAMYRKPYDEDSYEGLSVPTPVSLHHGTTLWEGERDEKAWLLLSDGRVWEPVSALICDRDKFYEFAAAEEGDIYSADEAVLNMMEHRHFGPWEEPSREEVSGNDEEPTAETTSEEGEQDG